MPGSNVVRMRQEMEFSEMKRKKNPRGGCVWTVYISSCLFPAMSAPGAVVKTQR